MELSENASAFSIESLISTSISDERRYDRKKSAKTCSWSGLSTQLFAAPRGGGCAAQGPAVSAPTNDPVVSQAVPLVHQIFVQNDRRRTLYHEYVDVLRERSPTGLFLGEQNCRVTGKPDSSEERHRRSLTSSILLGPEYSLQQHPPSTFKDGVQEAEGRRPVVETNWETASYDDAPDADILPDEPISIVADGIRVSLENSLLWKRFNKCGTEMIVNRVGRRMFPCIVTTIRGMDPVALYRVQMELTPSNRHRYKFINGKWLPVGKADLEHPNEPFEHPGSPSLGAYWMQDRVSFAKFKITNNKENVQTNTVLHSMHKYTPRIIITQLTGPDRDSPATACRAQRQHISPGGSRFAAGGNQPLCFEFQETSFIAVTAYHSDQITQLKIQHNPFAKAFRDADVTAILRGTCMLSESANEPGMPPMSGQVVPMHPTFQSVPMEWQSSSRKHMKQVFLDQPDRLEYASSLGDIGHRWHERSLTFPEFSRTEMSSLHVSMPHSTIGETSYSHQKLQECHSQPSLTFDTTKRMTAMSPRHTAKHRHSTGALREFLHRDATVNRSRSHPETNVRRVPGALPTSIPQYSSDFRREFNRTFHPLHRVSSAAESRPLKRYISPYYSPKKVLHPRYQSTDQWDFKESQLDGFSQNSDVGKSISCAENLSDMVMDRSAHLAVSSASTASVQQTLSAPPSVGLGVASALSHTSCDSSETHSVLPIPSESKESPLKDTNESKQ